MRYGIVSGGFDPLHYGHMRYLREAETYCDQLLILLNSDEWLIRKKGKPFMSWNDRYKLLHLILPNAIIKKPLDDKDSLEDELDLQRRTYRDIVFMKGGDRHPINTPELKFCIKNEIPVIFGVGGFDKSISSSQLIEGSK